VAQALPVRSGIPFPGLRFSALVEQIKLNYFYFKKQAFRKKTKKPLHRIGKAAEESGCLLNAGYWLADDGRENDSCLPDG
jgi:hypothetical protein